MTSVFTAIMMLLGLTGRVLAAEDAAPRCNLNLARVGEVLPPDVAASGLVRIVRPGQAVTMDFLPSRTTIALDAEGVVASIRCG